MSTLKTKLKLLGGGLILSSLISNASAIQIQGNLIMAGVAVPLDESNHETDLESSTGLYFANAFAFLGDGDFADITTGSAIDFQAFQFEPALLPSPVAPLWSIADPLSGNSLFEFDLTSINVNEKSGETLSLSGTGILSGAGFEDTSGIWNFTTQSPSVGPYFSFSAASAATPVPEASTVVTLGLGVIGLSIIGYRNRRRAASSPNVSPLIEHNRQ